MTDPAEKVDEREGAPTKRGVQPLWVVLVVALTPNVFTLITALVKTASANARADASYEATRSAVKLLQEHDAEHDRQYAALMAHVQVVEAWLGSMRADSSGKRASLPVPSNATDKQAWRPNFPPALQAPVQKRIEFTPSLDEIVEAVKRGEGDSVGVHEVYEGPPDKAPQWIKNADRAAAAVGH